MTIRLDNKKKVVLEIYKALKGSICVIVIDYRGMKSVQMMELRRMMRGLNVNLNVVRNTLARIAFKGTGYESLINVLYGPVLLIFSYDEPCNISSILTNFSSNCVKLIIKAFSFEFGEVIFSGLDKFISLPSYKNAIFNLIFVIKLPFKKLILIILEPYIVFIRLLNILFDLKKKINI